jgi:integrase
MTTRTRHDGMWLLDAHDVERLRTDAELAFERRFAAIADAPAVLADDLDAEVEGSEFTLGLRAAQQYATRSVAAGTLQAYRSGWRLFCAWAELDDRPVTPAAPDVVAAYLAALADAGYAYGTIALRLSAINFVHKLGGLPQPGHDEFVRRVLGGIARTIGRRPVHTRDAIDTERARRIIATTYEASPTASRDAVLAILGLHRSIGASALSRLDWADVVEGEERIELHVFDGTRSGHKVEVRVSDPTEREVLLPLLTGLRDRYGPDAEHVFDNGRGGRLSPSGVAKALARLARELPPPDPATDGWRWGGEVRLLVDRQHPIDIRDRAIILIGLVSAMRRSNLEALRWGDFTAVDRGLQVLLRRSKTDQEGEGFTVVLPRAANPRTCPVEAFESWRTEVRRQLGWDPLTEGADDWFFAPVDRHGHVARGRTGRPKPLDGHNINRIIASRAAQAGLEGNFGAHSLRVGFVTSAAAAGAPLHEIAEQTGHRSLEVLRGYVRTQEKWENSAASRLAL